ncbi:M23 family metallopeptidase [Tenacibaculum aestuariivivum]|uniref:M23 family metallopeptidase n=1 Tax=Tenacibaculum aestuariivivum TaxID=2006131 RepID=UPI003AB7122B
MKNKIFISLIIISVFGILIPQNLKMPVKGATKSDYHPKSFWFYPWGKSITHKGVDIFAKKGTIINSSTSGLVLYAGEIKVGGTIALVLGPKWRLHYYAHMDKLKTTSFTYVTKSEIIGTVGASGNAVGKAAHLHYAILTIIPYVWRIDFGKQGWKKMFYLNPIEYLENG